MSAVTITGLALTHRCMDSMRDDIAYLALSEINDRNRSVGAARVDFSAVGLSPWMKREAGDDDDPEEDEETGEDAGDDEDESAPDLRDALADDLVPTSQLTRAAQRWLVETVTSLMAGRTYGKFKIGLWSPGGKTLLHSARFEAKNPNARRTEADEEAEVEAERAASATPKAPDLTPTVHAPAPRVGPTMPEERVWHALGDGYTQLISLTQSTYSHIAKLQSAEIVSLSAQNKRLADTLESVSNDLRSVHIGTAEAQRDEANEAGSAKVREELGKQFIVELGSVGRAIASAKMGIPPELGDVVAAVQDSPELMTALQDPRIRSLLKEPEVAKHIAETLGMVAEHVAQAKAAQAKAPAAPPPATDPPPADGGAHAA